MHLPTRWLRWSAYGAAALAFFVSGGVEAQDAQAPRVAQAAWLAGHWRGEAFGGVIEEIWSPPLGNNMIGMFRSVKDGQASFIELISISEKDQSLILRLKHFHANLVGWEEKDKALEFPLITVADRQLVFEGMKYQKVGEDQLRIIVKTHADDAPARELTFTLQRVDSH